MMPRRPPGPAGERRRPRENIALHRKGDVWMKVGSLFSGIGGLDLGLERAGFDVIWQVEVDEWCRRVLERHWPDVPRYGDVREVHGAIPNATTVLGSGIKRPEPHGDVSCDGCLSRVDLICGGFPCQPVSHAGRRKGESDSRWLWPEFYRIIREVRPQWVLAENVPGLRSIDDGRVFGGILRDLAEAGYDAVWFDLSAADVGAPHLRERVFIVAYARERDGRAGGSRRPEHGSQRLRQPERPHEDVPRADAERCGRGQDDEGQEAPERDGAATGGVAHAEGITAGAGLCAAGSGRVRRGRPGDRDWWAVEPDVGRVAHGVPARVDRLRGLGNAVVPQVAEWIGRWILSSKERA